MSNLDFAWYLRTFDALFAFLYLHHVNAIQKPVPLRRHDWDWYLDRHHFFTFGSYNLMAGYAIETIIKCCLENADWKGRIFTHNLPNLAKELAKKWNLTIPADFFDYLKEFQDFIEWKGKYPIPKDPGAGDGPGLFVGGGQFNKVRELWSFFYNELKKRDWALTEFYLSSFRYDSDGLLNEKMEMFDIVDQVVKEKLVVCGKYVLYGRMLWRETLVKIEKWLVKAKLLKQPRPIEIRKKTKPPNPKRAFAGK